MAVALAARLEQMMTELNFEQLKQDFDRDGFVVLRGYRSPPSGISLWMALNHIDLHNGCLHYEKGSHKRDKPFGQPIRLSPARLRPAERQRRARRSRAGRRGHAYRADGALKHRSDRIPRPQRHGVRLLGSEFGGPSDVGEKIQVRLCGRRHDALARRTLLRQIHEWSARQPDSDCRGGRVTGLRLRPPAVSIPGTSGP